MLPVRNLLAPTLLLAAVLPAAVAAQAGVGLRADRERPGIMGMVVDRETRDPLQGVAVELRPLGAGADTLVVLPRALTDEAGRFVIGALADGAYRITIERIGYQPVVDSVAYSADLGLRIDVQFVLEAVELEPLLVVVEARSRYLDTNGFYDRRQRGIGRFITRDEIQERHPLEVSDVFRTMPGVRVSAGNAPGSQGVLLLRSGCVADVYIDGMRTISPFPIDTMLQPLDVQGIEVYHGSEIPARFGTTSCGAVVIWTHVPNPGAPGGRSGWKRIAVAAGFAAISFLLVR